jgi:hypothetical protein
MRLLEWKDQLNCVKHEWSDIKSSVSKWESVRGNLSLLLTFIIGIHNVIKNCDTIEGEGSCRKIR